jgi:hypothetical protein
MALGPWPTSGQSWAYASVGLVSFTRWYRPPPRPPSPRRGVDHKQECHQGSAWRKPLWGRLLRLRPHGDSSAYRRRPRQRRRGAAPRRVVESTSEGTRHRLPGECLGNACVGTAGRSPATPLAGLHAVPSRPRPRKYSLSLSRSLALPPPRRRRLSLPPSLLPSPHYRFTEPAAPA